jgi:signal transduction histidine kinase
MPLSRSRLNRAGFFLGSLLLALAVSAAGALSVARKVEGFQPVGFTAEPSGLAWRVAGVDHPATGLAPGDEILLVGGRQVGGEGEFVRELRRQRETDLVVLRGEAMAEIRYRRPALDLDLPYLVLTLIGVAYLGIGFYTLLRDRRRRALLFYLWCLTSAALYLVTPGGFSLAPGADGGRVTRLLFWVDELARIALPPLTLHLFLVFPAAFGGLERLRRTIPFLYLPAAVLLALRLDLVALGGRFLFARGLRAAAATLDRVEALHFVAFAVAAVAVLALRLGRSRDWEQARQVRWIAVGLAGGLLPFAGLYLLPWVVGVSWPEPVTAAAVAPLALVPLTFSWAILRYKLWDLGIIVRDAVATALTLVLGVAGFSLVQLVLSRGLPPEMAGARLVLSFVGGLAIAGLLLPARRGIATGLERLQYRDTFRKRRALADFARDLLFERDLERLSARLVARLEDAVGVDRAQLYFAGREGLVPAGADPTLPAPLPFDALGESFWDRDFLRLTGLGLPGSPALPGARLFAAGFRYVFPLNVRGHAVGFALVSYKEGEVPLNSDDLELIRQLLDQAALAIENAQLLERVQVQLDEVHRLQQYNEGIIESSPAGIAVVDGGGRVVSANAAFADLVGVERERLRGQPVEAILPVRPLPEPGGGLVEVSFCDLGDRQERHLQLSAAAFRRGAGEELAILVVHDVSDRVAMESALKRKDRLAALGVLAAGVAHEVNTPITGISSYAQMLLEETPEGDPRRALLEKVERQTFRAARIVNSLLEFARDREGELHPVALAPLVEDCLDLLRGGLARREIEVDWRPPAVPVAAQGIDGELQQVLTNLILNGADAMAEAGGKLTVRVGAEDGRALLEVADTGPGIPPDQLDKIFEPFFTTKQARGGTGLGLAISYEIVRRHGGEIRVDSAPGRGARFTVALPLAAS